MFGQFTPYAPITERKGIIAQTARFVLRFFKRGRIHRRLFDLAYEQMPISSNNVLGVAVEDSVDLGGGFHSVTIRIDSGAEIK